MLEMTGGRIRSGVWRGATGSTMHLVVRDKQVTGQYQTALGNPDPNDRFELTGFTDGELIGFVVLWEGQDSITSWAGRYGQDKQGEYITALWHLVHRYRDKAKTEPTAEWDSFMTNTGKWYYLESQPQS